MARGKGNQPLPGSKVEKIIDTMRAQREREIWPAKDLAAIIDVRSGALANMLKPSVTNGWIYRDNSTPRCTLYSLQPFPEPEAEEVPFSASLHDDGDLDLYGLQELETGGFRLSSEHVAKVRRMLTGEVVR